MGTDERALDTWVWCGHCSACAWGVPPHGQGEPCPLTVARFEWEKERAEENDKAYIAKLDAECMYWKELTKNGSPWEIIKRSLR